MDTYSFEIWMPSNKHSHLGLMHGQEVSRVCPATDDVIVSRFPRANADDIEQVVRLTKQGSAHPSWRDSPSARAQFLTSWAEAIQTHRDELAELLARESGKMLFEAGIEVQAAIGLARHYAAQALDPSGSAAVLTPGVHAVLLREPLGLVGVIVPWNWPLMLTMRAVGAALAGGNGVVVKPAELTTGCTLDMLALAPDLGVLRALPGTGKLVGEALSTHAGVDAISFTGSTAVGRRVMANAAQRIRRISLELGGKSPNIVFPDAQLDKVVDGIASGSFDTSGQVCTGGGRVLVHRDIADELTQRLCEMVNAKRAGDPFSDADMGPLASKKQQASVRDWIALGHRDGKLLAGGAQVPSEGCYVAPHLFGQLRPDSEILQKEIFGPVISIQEFASDEEAISLANSTEYGLVAGIWTQDLNRAWRVARDVQAGTVWVNTYHHFYDAIEETGWKQSGLGSARGSGGVEAFTQRKHINFDANLALW